MHAFFRVLLLLLLLLLGPLPLRAQPAIPGPSFEQVLSLRGAGSPAISPDGRSVVFSVNGADWTANRYDSELWIAHGDEAPFPLTQTKDGSSTRDGSLNPHAAYDQSAE